MPTTALRQQINSSSPLDLPGDFAVQLGRDAGDPASQNFSSLRRELRQKLRVLVVYLLNRNIETPARHLTVAFAKSDRSFFCLRFHLSNQNQLIFSRLARAIEAHGAGSDGSKTG